MQGPVAQIPALLQPVAHALIQARDEVRAIAAALPPELLWVRPAGAASAGFHLQHLSGVLDRLLTYARGEHLSGEQLHALAREGRAPTGPTSPVSLAASFDAHVDAALAQLAATPEDDLVAPRAVGRAGIPSTVIGLLVHAAEHTTRHVGQLLVTARVVPALRQ